VLVTDVDG